MSFSYQLGAYPAVDFPRMLVGDTQETQVVNGQVQRVYIFEDEEILSFAKICQAFFQSAMLYSGSAGANLPSAPVSYLRVAAMMLDAIASQKARIAITGLLDAKVNFQAAARELHAQAQAWREIEDNSGAFAIIEQCTTGWGFMDRFYKSIQRQTAQ